MARRRLLTPAESIREDALNGSAFNLVCHLLAVGNHARVPPSLPPSLLRRCLSVSSSGSHDLRRRSLAAGPRRPVIRWNFAAAVGEAKAGDRSFVCGWLRKWQAKAAAATSAVACRFWLMETQHPHVYIVICVHAGGKEGGGGGGGG